MEKAYRTGERLEPGAAKQVFWSQPRKSICRYQKSSWALKVVIRFPRPLALGYHATAILPHECSRLGQPDAIDKVPQLGWAGKRNRKSKLTLRKTNRSDVYDAKRLVSRHITPRRALGEHLIASPLKSGNARILCSFNARVLPTGQLSIPFSLVSGASGLVVSRGLEWRKSRLPFIRLGCHRVSQSKEGNMSDLAK